MNTQDNEPRAFPVNELNQYSGQVAVQHLGATLHDFFTAAAITGICSHVDTWGLCDGEIIAKARALADMAVGARKS